MYTRHLRIGGPLHLLESFGRINKQIRYFQRLSTSQRDLTLSDCFNNLYNSLTYQGFDFMRLLALALTLLITNAMAARIVIGTKSPNSGEAFEKNLSPMESKALVADEADLIGGFNYWVDSMVATPNQENAGSCLFMSHTASVEAILNQKEGYRKYDLSERYFMNLSKANVGDNLIDNWITDTIYRLNVEQKVYTNEVFPYKKDWYKIVGGTRVDGGIRANRPQMILTRPFGVLFKAIQGLA